jgi:hypothetical protein
LRGHLAENRMVYFFRRAGDTRMCESRSEPHGLGYELIVTEGRQSHVERFKDSQSLANRQCELRYGWLAHGWRDVAPAGEMDDDE